MNYKQVVSFAKKELQEVEFLLDTTDYISKIYESYDYCGQLFEFLFKSNDSTFTKIIINGLEKFHMKDIENIQYLIDKLER